MDATAETTSVDRTVTIAAPPEAVWEFLVDPEKLVRWMGVTAEVDARPGGIYRSEVIPGHVARGAYVEVEAPRRLVFTWGWERSGDDESPVPPGSSTVEVVLTPQGDGTSLHFVHRDLPSAEAAASHAHGWDHYLERLVRAAGGDDPGEDPWLTQKMTTA
jgi:uncharacterized protein YndB with AHSA1/START domain